MAYTAAPVRTALANTYPNPDNGTFKTGIGAMWDFITGLLGTSGAPEDAQDGLQIKDSKSILNIEPSFSVAASALTCTFNGLAASALSASNPGYIWQRSSTLGSGTYNRRKLTASPLLAVSSGATLGGVNAQARLLYWYAVEKDSATIKVAVAGSYLGQSFLGSTTLMSAASDFANILYADEALASKPCRLIAVTVDTQTTAGTYTSVPTEVRVGPFDRDLDFNAILSLTDAASITWDLTQGAAAKVTLTASGHTIANPTGTIYDNKEYTLWIIQDGTGSRTVSFGSAHKFVGGLAPTLTLTPAGIDMLVGKGFNGTIHWGFLKTMS